jgi:hypothetical protein
MASFKALVADTDTAVLGLTCNIMVSLSPHLAYHLFSTNSDNPSELGTTLACVMNSGDCYFSQLAQAPGTVATGPPAITPVLTPFYEACALLPCAALVSH